MSEVSARASYVVECVFRFETRYLLYRAAILVFCVPRDLSQNAKVGSPDTRPLSLGDGAIDYKHRYVL